MLNFVSPGERSASAGHQDKLLNPRRILVNPGELVSLDRDHYRGVPVYVLLVERDKGI